MALAAMNAGVYSMAMWTFTDIPNPDGLTPRLNKWGLTRWDGEDYSARDWLYAYGLFVKYFKYNSKPLAIETEDYLLRSGGVINDDGSFSVAVVNRHAEETELEISLENLKPGKKVRKYVYDSNDVPRSAFADMQDYEELLDAESGVIRVKMPGNAIVMLTTDYTDEKPSSVTGVCAKEGVVSWDASADPTHVYYLSLIHI